MKYMILMYSNPSETRAMSVSNRDAVARKHKALVAEMTASGELLNGAGLAYPEDARTMELEGETAVTRAGPFVPGDRHMTAYYVIEWEGPDRARALAERVLDFHVTAVEVREVHDWVGM